MRALAESWQFWALLSAVFAALTAIFAKVGVAGIGSDMATLIRTCVVVAVALLIVAATAQLSVVLVAVFAAVFLKERLSTLNWLGVAMIGAGAVLVAIKA